MIKKNGFLNRTKNFLMFSPYNFLVFWGGLCWMESDFLLGGFVEMMGSDRNARAIKGYL